MSKFFRNVSFYLLIIILAIWIIDYYSVNTVSKTEISYSNFIKQVQQDDVKQVTIVDNVITGKLKSGADFSTVAPDDPTLINTLRSRDVEIKAELPPQPPWWTTILSSLLPMLLILLNHSLYIILNLCLFIKYFINLLWYPAWIVFFLPYLP